MFIFHVSFSHLICFTSRLFFTCALSLYFHAWFSHLISSFNFAVIFCVACFHFSTPRSLLIEFFFTCDSVFSDAISHVWRSSHVIAYRLHDVTCVYLTWRALSQFYENVRSRTSRGLLSDFSQVNESAVWYPTNALWDISFLRKPAYSRVKFEIACSSNWTLMNLMRLLRTGSHFKHSIRRSQIQRNFFFFSLKPRLLILSLGTSTQTCFFFVLNLLIKGHRALAYLSEVCLDLNSRTQ